jgi:transcriptional regulator with XRE-family HTH domain
MDCLEKRLKRARKDAGLTQPQLAELIGVSRRTVVNYEKDASKASVRAVQNIAIECAVDEIWLLTGQGKMEAPPAGTDSLTNHQNLLNRFKDPELALALIERLITIESFNTRLYDRVWGYIDARYDSVKEAKVSDEAWNGLEGRAKQETWEVGERRRNGTENE